MVSGNWLRPRVVVGLGVLAVALIVIDVLSPTSQPGPFGAAVIVFLVATHAWGWISTAPASRREAALRERFPQALLLPTRRIWRSTSMLFHLGRTGEDDVAQRMPRSLTIEASYPVAYAATSSPGYDGSMPAG